MYSQLYPDYRNCSVSTTTGQLQPLLHLLAAGPPGQSGHRGHVQLVAVHSSPPTNGPPGAQGQGPGLLATGHGVGPLQPCRGHGQGRHTVRQGEWLALGAPGSALALAPDHDLLVPARGAEEAAVGRPCGGPDDPAVHRRLLVRLPDQGGRQGAPRPAEAVQGPGTVPGV